jgi:phosphoribosylformylglycinamidine cyclo-ligase
MGVNDILTQGAAPLFFLDYFVCGKLDVKVAEAVVRGIAAGCRAAGCALIGGETAEMPGFYADGEYDVAGFILGIVDRSRILDGKSIRHGDILIGLPSVGLHTNGYSLARKLFFEVARLSPDSQVNELQNSIGEELLKPHINYEPIVRDALAHGLIEGLAHITGGGITENVNRILPENCQAEVQLGSWPVLPLFRIMADIGKIERDEMLRATNMGIGMVVVVRPANLESFTATLKSKYYQIGRIIPGPPRVTYRT